MMTNIDTAAYPTTGRRRRRRGLTLAEILVAATITTMVAAGVIAIMVQGGKIFTKIHAHMQPQASEMLVIQRIQKELREAYAISLTSTPYSLEFIPVKKKAGTSPPLTDVQQNLDGTVSPKPENFTIRYFTGTMIDGKAHPDPNGTMLFRIPSTVAKDSNGDYSINGSKGYIYLGTDPQDRDRIVTTIPDPNHPGSTLSVPPFSYTPGGNNPTLSTRVIGLTFHIPVQENGANKPVTTYQRLSTQLAVRNLPTF